MKFTIFGASGFIGSHLSKAVLRLGATCETPSRDDPSIYKKYLGHVIYAIGLTSNFREHPYDTVRAHVSHLIDLLEKIEFESFLYLSSTRVYLKCPSGEEENNLWINPLDQDDLYNLSKLMGESICFASDQANVRVARLSNVFGKKEEASDFLASLISDALEKGKVSLKSGIASEKDYVSVDDVAAVLPKIAMFGRHRLYNVASGKNVSHQSLLNEIQNITDCDVEISEAAENTVFPEISIKRLQAEFNFSPAMLIPSLGRLVPQYAMRSAHD